MRRSERGVGVPFEEIVDQGRTTPVRQLGPEAVVSSSAHRQVTQIRLVLSNWRLIWRFVWIGAVLTALLSLIWPKQYESTTRLMPPDSSNSAMSPAALLSGAGGGSEGGSSGGGGILSMYAASLLGMKSSGGLFVGILKSDTVLDGVINKFDLRKVYHLAKYEDARKRLARLTHVDEDKKSGIISISVMDSSPERAAGIAQAYVDELDLLVAQLSTSSARRERIFLEGRLKSVKQDLDTASQQLGQFSSTNTTFDPKEQGRAMVQGVAELEGELIATEAQLSGLQQIYTDNNVRVRTLKARVQELKTQLQKLQGAPTIDESQIASGEYPSIRQLPLLAVTYSDLYRREKIEETVYEILTKQYELAKVQEAKEIPTVRVLDKAQVPEWRVSPRRSRWVMIGTFLSFIVGIAFIFSRERWDAISPEEPRKALILELLDAARARVIAFRMRARSSKLIPFHRKDNLS